MTTSLSACELVIDIPGRPDGKALTFRVGDGELWGVLGPNGAGKTTLLQTMAGLRSPRHGAVMLENQSIAALGRRQVAQRLAVVFQERQDGFPSTVHESVMIGRHPFLAPWELERAEDLSCASEALARLELDGFEDRQVSTLSGGERQRLAIATALAQTPWFWLLDEPTNHLDLRHQVLVMRLLRAHASEGGAVLMCLHDLNLAARWCTHVLLLYPDGSACWGDASTMLLPSALETLYGQRLVSSDIDGCRVFVPVVR